MPCSRLPSTALISARMAKDASSDDYYARESTPSQSNTPLHTNPLTNPALPNTTSKTHTGILSEHGHSLVRIQPMARHSGDSVITFFNGLFTTIIGIATLGASITFSVSFSGTNEELASVILCTRLREYIMHILTGFAVRFATVKQHSTPYPHLSSRDDPTLPRRQLAAVPA